MPPTYRIKDWNENFENHRTRVLADMRRVYIPNKLDGEGYTELLDHPSGGLHYAAWITMLQVASKCSPRGTLMRGTNRPHDVHSLSRITRIPAEVFEEAIPRLIAIDWLEVVEEAQTQLNQGLKESGADAAQSGGNAAISGAPAAQSSAPAAQSSATAAQGRHQRGENRHTNGMEWNGMEHSAKEQQSGAAVAAPKPARASPAKKRRSTLTEMQRRPALVAIYSITRRRPDPTLWDKLCSVIGDSPDIVKLRRCYEEWRERGYNPQSWKWATEWYRTGVPQQQGQQSVSVQPEVRIPGRLLPSELKETIEHIQRVIGSGRTFYEAAAENGVWGLIDLDLEEVRKAVCQDCFGTGMATTKEGGARRCSHPSVPKARLEVDDGVTEDDASAAV